MVDGARQKARLSVNHVWRVFRKKNQLPAVKERWALKAEATRVFLLADADKDGKLNLTELTMTLKNPSQAKTVMANLDVLDRDGKVSLAEWLVAQKCTFDKSELACKSALKMTVKAITANREKAATAAAGVADVCTAEDGDGEASPRSPRAVRAMATTASRTLQQAGDVLALRAVDHLSNLRTSSPRASRGADSPSSSFKAKGLQHGTAC
jgi:hypothetical protein